MRLLPSLINDERAQYKKLFEAIQEGDNSRLLYELESDIVFENRMYKKSAPFPSDCSQHEGQSVADVDIDTSDAIKAQLLQDPVLGVQWLMEHYGVLFEGSARAILHRYDLVQEALSRSWYKIYIQLENARANPELLEAKTLLWYFYTIVRHTACRVYVQEQKHRFKLKRYASELQITQRWNFEHPEDHLEREERKALVNDTLKQHPPKYERILRLRYLSDDETVDDDRFCHLAQEMGINSSTLRCWARRAKERMRKLLEDQGVRSM